jgi:hypothetical protein
MGRSLFLSVCVDDIESEIRSVFPLLTLKVTASEVARPRYQEYNTWECW